MAYTYRPHWYDLRSYDPYGYWGFEDITTAPASLTGGVLFVYKEDDRELLLEFEDEREFTFTYIKDADNMSRSFYTEKQPNEYLTYIIDFSEELATGAT